MNINYLILFNQEICNYLSLINESFNILAKPERYDSSDLRVKERVKILNKLQISSLRDHIQSRISHLLA
jgi:hypothetical protein